MIGSHSRGMFNLIRKWPVANVVVPVFHFYHQCTLKLQIIVTKFISKITLLRLYKSE